MIELGEDFNGIFDDGNFSESLSRFQVKYPPSRNPYKCFPPPRLLMSPPAINRPRSLMSMYFTKKNLNLQQFLLQIYLWNKSMLFNVYEISIPCREHLG